MPFHERLPQYVPPQPLRDTYEKLYWGLRDEKDPVTWRTTIVDLMKLLEEPNPEQSQVPSSKAPLAESLVKQLMAGTRMEPLSPEILSALGVPRESWETLPDIDALLFNGRHKPEKLLWGVANNLTTDSEDSIVAVINPVGHFNDGQTRIVAPSRMLRPVDKLIILASTQENYGGNVSVLANTIRTLRNENFACCINEVDVVIPMFGGSRGDKPGQGEDKGFEVLEAIFNAKLLALSTRDVLDQLSQKMPVELLPTVRFVTVDIHSSQYPRKTFEELDFESLSANPQQEFASAALAEISAQHCEHLPIRIVATDAGAVARNEELAKEILKDPRNRHSSIEILYVDKKRGEAGTIKSVSVERAERWVLSNDGSIEKMNLVPPTLNEPSWGEYVLLSDDDIFDTGGTAKADMELVKKLHPNARLSIFAATHPVLSKGHGILDEMPVDIFLFGNTLSTNGLSNHPKVRMVDVSPSIVRTLYEEKAPAYNK